MVTGFLGGFVHWVLPSQPFDRGSILGRTTLFGLGQKHVVGIRLLTRQDLRHKSSLGDDDSDRELRSAIAVSTET
jgi:hypothetical protein